MLAYLVGRFPTVTETFILREINALSDQGMRPKLYTLIVEQPEVVHDDAASWLDDLSSVSPLDWRMWAANLRLFFTRPLLYLMLLWLTFRELWGTWNFLLRDLWLFPQAVRYAEMMQADGIQHLHAHWATHPAYVAYIVHRITGISYSFTAHAHDIYIRKAMLCRKVRAARFVATISEFNVRELVNDCGEDIREKLAVVRCGVPSDTLRTEPRPPQDAPFTILTVASLRDYKGHPDAIRACAKLKADGLQFRWWIVGGGPDREALQSQIDAAGVGDVMQLLGSKSAADVQGLMQEADCFVMSSIMLPDRRMDGIPVALMEALANAIPTVATAVSGIPELVQDGVTGWLVPERDPDALAGAIRALQAQPEEAQRRAQAGRQLIHDEFRVETNAARLHERFTAILARPLRVHVVEASAVGGLIHYSYQLCRALQNSGVETTLVTSTNYELDDWAHNFPVEKRLRLWNPRDERPVPALWRKVRRVWRGVRYVWAWVGLVAYLRRAKPDVIVLSEIRFAFEQRFIRHLKQRGFTLVDIAHNVQAFDTSRNRDDILNAQADAANKRLYALFDAVFVHNEHNRQLFLQLYDNPPERVISIPHATNEMLMDIPPTTTPEALRERLNIPAERPVVLFFGTLTKYKGVDDLMHAFAKLRHDAQLVIAGYPSKDMDTGALKQLAADLAIDGDISWYLDYVPNEEIRPLMALASVVALPYRAISQSGVLQIAYACGRPVVATRVGALPEVVEDGKTGKLATSGDPDSIAAALDDVLHDPERAERMGERARHLAETQYAWASVAQTMQTVFSDLLRNRTKTNSANEAL